MTEDLARILKWPRETWSPQEAEQVNEHRSSLHREMFALAETAEREERNLTREEQDTFDALQAEFDRLGAVPSQQR